jgi:potassium efflux system protein
LCGIFGILFAVHIVGFSWSSVQWLAAGLTVGLGFGLQEIFANLFSGIIILIERPVRVGDFVTVNGITGTVSRMELRATTIRDLDHRELIVPNKKFITDDVMNWTLSDSLYRTIISVGVAYGSDTKLVADSMMEVARRHPQVRHDPAPEVVFKCFGESTLDFELRVVLPDRDSLPKIQHELNMAIDQSFRQKNIEIAFPQREIRVRHTDASAIVPPATADESITGDDTSQLKVA